MYKLERFLVKEGYCNTERQANKILESISDEFYSFLLEGIEDDEVSKMRQKLKSLMSEILSETDPEKKQALGDEYKKLKARIDSSAKDASDVRKVRDVAGTSSLSSRPTPRGEGGSRVQKREGQTTPRGGASIPDVDNPRSANLDAAATRLLQQHGVKIRPGSRGTRSVDSNRPDTKTIISNRFNPQGSSGVEEQIKQGLVV